MGYLLKEALKTLCGVNQWSYAVFWKFGYQNRKLLIWEECYYELDSNSRPPWIIAGNKNLENGFQDFNNSWVSDGNCNVPSGVQAQDTVHLLVNKMMENHVNIVGEGLVGRVAFTGNHQWILSENYYGETNLPEVVKEVCQQLSAGIKTIAVIPVLPHGVVQFGSYLTILENLGFINNVTSLVLQLGNIPGTLLSDNYASKELALKIVVPACLGNSTPSDPSLESNMINASSFITDSLNYVGSSIPVIHSNTEIWRNQHASRYVPSSPLDLPSGNSALAIQNPKNISLTGYGYGSDGNRTGNEKFAYKCSASSGHRNVNLSKMESSFSVPVDNLTANSLLGYSYVNQPHQLEKFAQSKFFACNEDIGHNISQSSEVTLPQQNENLNTSHSGNYTKYDDPCVQLQSGDDLFDILGADFKNKMFGSCWNSCMSNESTPNKHISDNNNIHSKKSLASSEAYSTSQGNSDIVILSTGTDHLLDAVVSKVTPTVTQCSNDSVSCRTSLTNTGTSSAPNVSLLPYGRFDQMKGELFGVPKYLGKAGAMSSCSLRTLSSKEEKGTCSPSSSIYGSQISSWIEKGQNTMQDNSVSTGCSKKPSETSKTNRKRLKPGENPRPRPKDRQMIQDRVKELRELVPNGAKCSIDSLLERTIKHMLFLQSVTKHADKLKQTGESKLIGKDGNLLLKDNFEGGATWAYEIGLQSMVCPIIVEDLNQPRQMLVEMLCEERGLFLEIADIIRGLGLTILKGVMETRNDKIWARFAVEANRDVTRMEIFISLVRLLEQSAKDVPQDKKMVQQFHQAPTLPVTGISDIMH